MIFAALVAIGVLMLFSMTDFGTLPFIQGRRDDCADFAD
ncbi:hypothetical protein M527_07240 [Sphingobium indicum IP26]|nr:hypothetical protein M527_07240 [Sphingobium indicum IP26]